MTTGSVLKKLSLATLGASVIALGAATSAQANSIIFDGGGPNPQTGREMTAWVQTDDFILSTAQSLTAVQFWTLERSSGKNWDGNLSYFLFNDNGGLPANTPFVSGNGVNIVKQATGNTNNPFDDYGFNLQEYKYSFNLQNSISLSASTKYWLGLHLSFDFDRDEIHWESTSAGFGSTGKESFQGTFDNWEDNGINHAFNLNGTSEKVPEPSSILGFLALGTLGAGSLKRKQQQKVVVKA
ncbi:MAG: PEP-CTERM sorting domain-containing protein [Trichocoleus desertorum ATA4-8-CV12]|jgi:hypothetical protein|nr:PEP-CTERM sorting domain-containing protein [Trichocoleus desertorum ATA4-8-CV12]